MAFDYAGSFSNLTGHLSNVFPSIKNPLSTPFNTEQAVTYYSQHVASEKIILGMPIYGRSFNNTKGLGLPYNGTGSGTWEAGVWDYKALPLAGSKVYHDVQTVTSWSYDSKQGLLISYDTPEIAAGKTEYLKRRSLGGAFWWESSADKAGNDSLVTTVRSYHSPARSSFLIVTNNSSLFRSTIQSVLHHRLTPAQTGSAIPTQSTITSETLHRNQNEFTLKCLFMMNCRVKSYNWYQILLSISQCFLDL